MEQDSGQALSRLAVDGGMSNSDLAMQTQADLIQVPVERPRMRETTALGAAFAAGLAVGVWADLEQIANSSAKSGGTVFTSEMKEERSKEMFERWEMAVKRCEGFV